MKSPANPPTCEHGRVAGTSCRECHINTNRIADEIKPLVDEFWDHRGVRDLRHLMARAYRMGMKYAQSLPKKETP